MLQGTWFIFELLKRLIIKRPSCSYLFSRWPMRSFLKRSIEASFSMSLPHSFVIPSAVFFFRKLYGASFVPSRRYQKEYWLSFLTSASNIWHPYVVSLNTTLKLYSVLIFLLFVVWRCILLLPIVFVYMLCA